MNASSYQSKFHRMRDTQAQPGCRVFTLPSQICQTAAWEMAASILVEKYSIRCVCALCMVHEIG